MQFYNWWNGQYGPSKPAQRCFNVDFRSRRWTTNFQRWNNVIDFNVEIATLKQRRTSTLLISTLKKLASMLKRFFFFKWKKKYGTLRITTCFNPFSTPFQRLNITLKQRQISTLIRFNKIEGRFNVEVRRYFNLYLPARIRSFWLLNLHRWSSVKCKLHFCIYRWYVDILTSNTDLFNDVSQTIKVHNWCEK